MFLIIIIIWFFGITQLDSTLGSVISSQFKLFLGYFIVIFFYISNSLFSFFTHALKDLISELNLDTRIGKLIIDIIAYAYDILIMTNIEKNV